MAGFADELRAAVDMAARKIAEARLAGDDYGAVAWHERLSYLRRVARRHDVELSPGPGPVGGGDPREDRRDVRAGDGSTQASLPAASTLKETG